MVSTDGNPRAKRRALPGSQARQLSRDRPDLSLAGLPGRRAIPLVA